MSSLLLLLPSLRVDRYSVVPNICRNLRSKELSLNISCFYAAHSIPFTMLCNAFLFYCSALTTTNQIFLIRFSHIWSSFLPLLLPRIIKSSEIIVICTVIDYFHSSRSFRCSKFYLSFLFVINFINYYYLRFYII